MNYGYMIVYQKRNGELLYRATKNKPMYSKGTTTNYGWKVVDIQRLYNGKTYSYTDYNVLLNRKIKISNIISIFNIDNIKKVLYTTMLLYMIYCFITKKIFF